MIIVIIFRVKKLYVCAAEKYYIGMFAMQTFSRFVCMNPKVYYLFKSSHLCEPSEARKCAAFLWEDPTLPSN